MSAPERVWLWRWTDGADDEWWGTMHAPDKLTARIRLERRLPEEIEKRLGTWDANGTLTIWLGDFFMVAHGYR